MRRWLGIFIALVVSALSTQAFANSCTLLSVKEPDKSELRVYFTKFIKEDNTGGKFKNCRLVKVAEQGTKSFFVTPFRQDANVIVHPSNWP